MRLGATQSDYGKLLSVTSIQVTGRVLTEPILLQYAPQSLGRNLRKIMRVACSVTDTHADASVGAKGDGEMLSAWRRKKTNMKWTIQ